MINELLCFIVTGYFACAFLSVLYLGKLLLHSPLLFLFPLLIVHVYRIIFWITLCRKVSCILGERQCLFITVLKLKVSLSPSACHFLFMVSLQFVSEDQTLGKAFRILI